MRIFLGGGGHGFCRRKSGRPLVHLLLTRAGTLFHQVKRAVCQKKQQVISPQENESLEKVCWMNLLDGKTAGCQSSARIMKTCYFYTQRFVGKFHFSTSIDETGDF